MALLASLRASFASSLETQDDIQEFRLLAIDPFRVWVAMASGCIRAITDLSFRPHSSATLFFTSPLGLTALPGDEEPLHPGNAPLRKQTDNRQKSQLSNFGLIKLSGENRIRLYLCLEWNRE